MNKSLKIIVALAITALLGWQVYRKVSGSAGGSRRGRGNVAVAVEVAPIQKATIRDVGVFTGSLFPVKQFVAAPKISGRLEKILVNIGDEVKRDQLIAVLDDDEYVLKVDQAKAELRVARANYAESRSSMKIAKRGYERIKTLREKKIASESELDETEAFYKSKRANYRVGLAQVKQAKALLKTAEVALSYTQIRASWSDGDELRVVGERFVDEGAMLRANDKIVSILDISSLTAVIYVVEGAYSRIKTGQEATISTDAFPERDFTGKIIRVAPMLKETSRQARVEIDIRNTDRLLKPGMFIRAQVVFATHEDTTVVPVASLVRRDEKRGVFLADDQNLKVRFVPIKLGIVNGEQAEVVSPPLSGPVVIIGQHLLEDGASIILPGKRSGSRESSEGSGPKKRKH